MRVIIVDKDGFLVTKEDVLQVEFLGDRIAIELPNLKIDTLKLDTNIKTINFQDIAIDQVIFLEKEIAQLKDELKARKELCDLRYEQLKKQDEELKGLNLALELACIEHKIFGYCCYACPNCDKTELTCEECCAEYFKDRAKEKLNA